ncbi:MAG: Bug family tripartite tricarboxylate transporter substrate binding protein [Pigmentiphaga sp.]
MFNLSTRYRRVITGLVVSLALAGVASAQGDAREYPDRPIRIIVPYAPGGGTDFTARLLAKKLSENVGQPVIVDNRPGAATNIGASALVQAEPDGYTLLLSAASTYAINPNLHKEVPYDVFRDFAPVARVALLPLLLVANPSFPADTFPDFLKHVKSLPDGKSIQFGSAGLGSTHQLAMERLAQRADFRAVHVPYKGAAPAMLDLISGVIPIMFLDLATGAEQIKAGKVKVVATGSTQRAKAFPDIPTIAESGLSDYEAAAWIGIVAPANTPDAIVQKLNSELNKVVEDPSVRESLYQAGAEPIISTPEEFTEYLKSENEIWADVIRQAGLAQP